MVQYSFQPLVLSKRIKISHKDCITEMPIDSIDINSEEDLYHKAITIRDKMIEGPKI